MQKIKEDCFWHRSFKDYNDFTDAFETFHQCELAEPWTCPCAQDCEWYVSKDNVKAHIYNLQLKCREKLKED